MAMTNPYGITLDREWSEWAAKASVSPTVAAALFLISRSRPLPETVARLTPGEFEQVVGVIGRLFCLLFAIAVFAVIAAVYP
jgi:hypothetical protein